MKSQYYFKLLFQALSFSFFVSCIHPDIKPVESPKGLITYKIVYKTLVDQPNLKSKSLMTQWVDKESNSYAVHTATEMEILGAVQSGESLMISKDGWSYVVNLETKSGFQTREQPDDKLTAAYVKPAEEETFRNAIESEGGKIRGKEVFLGFECLVAELPERDESGQELKSTVWYYKGIPLKMSNRNYTMEAISFEADIPIPEQHFQVPDDVEITIIPAL